MFRLASRSVNLVGRNLVNKRFYATETQQGAGAVGGDLLSFTFMVPHQTIFKDKRVQLLTLPGAKGTFGVAKNHVPKIAELKPGVVQINHENGDNEKFFISGGFAMINTDSTVFINAVEAVPIDQLDANAVKSGLTTYTQQYNDATDEEQKALALIGLEIHQQMAYAVGVTL
eukprot:gene2281-2808_t